MTARMPPPAVARRPAWLIAAAGAYIAYVGLLLYCDLGRPQDPGLVLAVQPDGLVVSAVVPGSVAAAAGLQPGDRIAEVNGRAVRWRLDWFAVAAQIRPGVPVTVGISRPAARKVALVPQAAGLSHWRRREGLGLAAARLTQLASLALALLIAFRRPHDTRARRGAWLLASIAVFCIAPPWGLAAAWRALPAPMGWLLWGPHVSALAIGAILASFFASFRPGSTPLDERRLGTLVWVPMIAALAWHVRFAWLAVYRPQVAVDWSPWLLPLPILTLVYTIGAVVLLVWTYRRIADLNERRRVRVLVAGTLVGVTAALAVVTLYWGRPDDEVAASPFASSILFAGTLTALVFPGSLAYAILRHRLLDVSLILRQGLRYALARRALLSMAPALALLVSIDLMTHADEPVSAILARRGWVYGLLVAAVVLARVRRDAWLDALDRRFFRDRYQGQRIIRDVLASVREAGTIEPAAPRIVQAVAQALHPTHVRFVSRSRHGEGTTVLARTPPAVPDLSLGRHSRILDLALALGRPLDLAPEAAPGLASQLPPDDWALVSTGEIEIVVPVPGEPGDEDLFLLLGAKKSEEPYTSEDVELLATIADGLAVARAPRPEPASPPAAVPSAAHPDPPALAECPECGRCEGAAVPTCPDDGTPMVVVPIPRRLNGRYGIERRLGRGGMGVVYLAHDTALDRRVAIKVIRWDSGDVDAARRFAREARAAASLSHPHVVTVHDVGNLPGGAPFLVMEYLPGPSLREWLVREGAVEPGTALPLLDCVASAVDAAHGAGLVHRDLKPENILLGSNREWKVTDFGLARAYAAEGPGDDTRLTREGGAPGTPEYMAPEQIRQEAPSPSWDRWALTVVAFEMLTGELPFAAAIGEGRAVRLPLRDAADPAIRRVFGPLLAPDPAERPASARAVVEAIAGTVARQHG